MSDQTQVSRDQVRRDLWHITRDLEPDATGAAMLLERLDELYKQIIDEATGRRVRTSPNSVPAP
jgi:hypothetical protein